MRRARSIAALLGVSLLACAGSETLNAPTVSSIAGTYILTSANGAVLPFILQAANPKVEVLGDQMVLKADGTWSEAGSFRLTDGTSVTTQAIAAAGTFTLSGKLVTLTEALGGAMTDATLGTNSMTLSNGSVTFVYTK